MKKRKTTRDITRDQMMELKWKYFYSEDHEYAYPDEIFDEVIHKKYEGVTFIDDDFNFATGDKEE